MVNKVPEGWFKEKCGNVFTLEYGKPLPKREREDGKYPVYGSNGVVDHHTEFLVNGPGIVVGRKGTAGKVIWTANNFYPIDTTFFVVPDQNVDLRWLYYTLIQQNLAQLAEATGVPGLNRNWVAIESMLVPPLPEQKKIAAILSSVDEAIEATEAVIEQTRTVKKGLLQELLTRGIGHTEFKKTAIGEIPKSWRLMYGKEVFTLSSGISPTSLNFNSAGELLYVKVGDISNSLNQAGVITARDSLNADSQSENITILPKNTIVFAKRGAAISKNRVRLLKSPAVIDTNVMAMSAKSVILPTFLISWLSYKNLSSYMDDGGLPQINNKHLEPQLFPVPPLNEQEQICSLLENMDETLTAQRKTLMKLTKIKRGLLQDLLTGKVRVNTLDLPALSNATPAEAPAE